MHKKLLFAAALSVWMTVSVSTGAGAQEMRRLSVGLVPVFYLFDDSYFGIGNGGGADLVTRYEIRQNVFFENRLGLYSADQDGNSITGFNGQIGATAFPSIWIPWRPSVRLAFALMTADPVVSEPVEAFRPSQTVFYLVAGAGITRSISADFQLEGGIDLMFTPYEYRVYKFYRQYVEMAETRFVHLAFFIGASYTF